MPLRAFLGAALFLLFAPSLISPQSPQPDPQAAQREAQSGVLALQQGRYPDAARHFYKAEQLAGAATTEINAGIAIAELQLGHFDIVRAREAKVLAAVSDDHRRAEAHNIIGMSWSRQSVQAPDRDSSAMLRSAEDSFRRAVQLDPVFDSAYFNLGETLLRQNRDAEAAHTFKKFIEAAAKNPAQNLGFPLSPQGSAPTYKFVDTEGRILSSDALLGHFVLLDFWATWCPPCLRALPALRELAHYFPPEQLTVISVNEDTAGDAMWRRFLSENNMNWTQVRDPRSEIYFRFPLSAASDLSLPRYVFLDPTSAILHVYNGTDRLGQIVGQIVKTVLAAQADPPRPRPSPNAPDPAPIDPTR